MLKLDAWPRDPPPSRVVVTAVVAPPPRELLRISFSSALSTCFYEEVFVERRNMPVAINENALSAQAECMWLGVSWRHFANDIRVASVDYCVSTSWI